MRTLLLFLLLAPILYLSSCSEKVPTQDDLVKANTEEYLKPKLNDPDSYEFTRIELIDSVLYSDNIEWRINNFQRQLDDDKEYLKKWSSKLSTYKLESIEKIVDLTNISIEKNEKILNAIDSIKTSLGSKINDIASYTYLFSYRSNNALGVKVLKEYIIQTEPKPTLNVINMTDDKSKVYNTPNNFPGYEEMIKKNL